MSLTSHRSRSTHRVSFAALVAGLLLPAAAAAQLTIATTAGTTAYAAPGAGVVVDPSLTVQSADPLDRATVSITSGYASGQDVLSFTPQSGITGSFDPTTGVLSLAGAGTAATYQAALRSVTFANASGAPTAGLRQITFAHGSGLLYSGTGHFYEYVASPDITWSAANTAAAAARRFGLTGYLATVTSAGENAFVHSKLAGDAWLGGSTPVFTEPRIWSWVTGPEAGTDFCTHRWWGWCEPIGGAYNSWSNGEPNNFGSSENRAQMHASDGTWNDMSDTPSAGWVAGYVVEYGGMAGDPPLVLSATRAVQVDLVPFALTFATDGTAGATLTGTTSQIVLAGGSASAVTANAPATHYFVDWTGTNGFTTTSANPLAVTSVAASHDITAHFAARAATAIAVASSAQPSAFGEPVSFTASVTPSAATGTVQFSVDGVDLGTPVALSGGVAASPSISSLASGVHTVAAVYSGATAYLGASGSATQDVVRAATAISVLPSLASFSHGTPVTLTATLGVIGPGAGTPTGAVDFTADGVAIPGCSGVAVSGGTFATCASGLIPAGTLQVAAAYLGDASFLPSGTATATVSVSRAAASVAPSASPSPATFGDAVTLSAAVSGAGLPPGGTVTFSDGATPLCSVALNGGAASCTTSSLAAGARTISAGFGGDANYLAASGSLSLQVDAAPTSTALASSGSPSTRGASVTFTATVTSARGTPTGTVGFSDGATTLCPAQPLSAGVASCTVSGLGVGTHTIGAAYSGDASFQASSGQAVQLVDAAPSTLTFTASPSPAAYGQPVTLTLHVTATGSGAPATGSATFTDGSAVLCGGPVQVIAGTATCTAPALAAGTHLLGAAFGGDPNLAGATATASLTVAPGAAAVAVASSRNPSRRGRPVTFTATVTSAHATPVGSVTFQDGGVTLGTAALTGGVATLTTRELGKGDHAITAAYAPSADFAGQTGSLSPVQVVENTPPVAGAGTALALGATSLTRATIPTPLAELDHAVTTVELWARAGWAAAGEVTGVPSLLRLGNGSGTRLALGVAPDRSHLVVTAGATDTPVAAALEGGWHHLALLASGSSVEVLVDGTPVGSVSGGLDAAVTSTALTLGQGFTGAIDEVRVWSVSRSASELAAASRRPLRGDEVGLAGCWRMDEGGGTELFDASAGHLDGVLELPGAPAAAPFVASTAWRDRNTWQERDMVPADAGYDADGDALTLTIDSAAAHGTASTDPALLQVGYHPAEGYLGSDRLTFRLDDGTASSDYELEIAVNRIVVCQASADCGGGDACVQGTCRARSDLSVRSGDLGCATADGGPLALLGLLALAFTRRRRPRRAVPATGKTP